MGVNKVTYSGRTLIDLTGDTVTAGALLEGYVAHDKAGNQIVGSCKIYADYPYDYTLDFAGGARIKTATSKRSSNGLTLAFNVEAAPKGFAVTTNTGITARNSRYITSMMYGGGSLYSTYFYATTSSAQTNTVTTCTFSYSDGVLTLTSDSASSAGYFRSGVEYILMYAY